MNKIRIIKVGNGTSEYFGNFTKKEIEIIKNHIIGYSLELFSGNSVIGDKRIDLYSKKANLIYTETLSKKLKPQRG